MTASTTTIHEIVRILRDENQQFLNDIDFYISNAIALQLPEDILRSAQFSIVDDYPKASLLSPPRGRWAKRLILRGPEYRRREGDIQVCGFADATILPPQDLLMKQAARSSTGFVKSAMKLALLKRYDEYIVQTDSAAMRLADVAKDKPIYVVPNSLHPILTDPSRWTEVDLPDRGQADILMFYPAGPIEHKNHRFIIDVARELKKKALEFRVVTTMGNKSKLASTLLDNECFVDVGRQHASTLPSLYKHTDGVFFPSLLETFSSVSIEAEYFDKPLFASDLPFVREVAGDYPHYFDPTDKNSAVKEITHWVQNGGTVSSPAEVGSGHPRPEYLPENNARRYLNLLMATG